MGLRSIIRTSEQVPSPNERKIERGRRKGGEKGGEVEDLCLGSNPQTLDTLSLEPKTPTHLSRTKPLYCTRTDRNDEVKIGTFTVLRSPFSPQEDYLKKVVYNSA